MEKEIRSFSNAECSYDQKHVEVRFYNREMASEFLGLIRIAAKDAFNACRFEEAESLLSSYNELEREIKKTFQDNADDSEE